MSIFRAAAAQASKFPELLEGPRQRLGAQRRTAPAARSRAMDQLGVTARPHLRRYSGAVLVEVAQRGGYVLGAVNRAGQCG